MANFAPSAGAKAERRLGVAVELPADHAAELAAVRRRAGDPAADDMAPHITLVPPVLVPGDLSDVEQVLQAAAARIAPFEVHLRGTGSFRPVSEVVFVAVAQGISSLELLAAAVRVPPLDPPLHFPYHPHVTVAHDVPTAALDAAYEDLAGFDARFTVSSFRLYEKDPAGRRPLADGRRWHAILDLPLRGRSGATL